MLNGALFAIIEEACTAVLTLMEGIEESEFSKSRLTRGEVRRQLLTIAASTNQILPEVRRRMPELDWDGWMALGRELDASKGTKDDEMLWFGIRSLAPATLMWLRVYRQNEPTLFKLTA